MTTSAVREGNGAQDIDTLQVTVAVESPPPPLAVAETEQEFDRQPVVASAEKSEEQEVAEEKPRDSDPGEDVAVLKAEVAELKSALEAKTSLEETQALEATVGSLKELFSENGAKAQREEEESQAKAQQALGGLQERVTTLRADLGNLERTLRASRAQEQVQPNAVPPEVLQQVYEQILTEIFQEMTRTMGPGASRRAMEIMEYVRRANTGMGFFRLVDDKWIAAAGLPEAIRKRLLSPSQIHLTFSEFRRQLAAQVPRYRPRRFEDLVDTRTSAYSVATIRRLVDQAGELGEKLNGIVRRLDTLEATAKEGIASINERLAMVEQRTQETNGPR